MATPKKFPVGKPATSSPRPTTSVVSPSEPVSVPQVAFSIGKAFKSYHVAFIGRPGGGRNSLAWRMNNLNDSELGAVPFLPRREIALETSTRPALGHTGVVGLQIRIVPPDELHGQIFFDKRGGIQECDVLVFVVDLGDEKSSDDFYTFIRKAQKYSKGGMPPFLIVGNKVDLRLYGITTPYSWGKNAALTYSAIDYLECSAKTNDRVGNVLDAILKLVL